MQKVESVVDQPAPPGTQSFLESLEIRSTAAILNDDLTVENGHTAGQPGGCLGNNRIPVCPVVSLARESADLTVLQNELRAVAVLLDLVDLLATFGRLVGQARELGRDEL